MTLYKIYVYNLYAMKYIALRPWWPCITHGVEMAAMVINNDCKKSNYVKSSSKNHGRLPNHFRKPNGRIPRWILLLWRDGSNSATISRGLLPTKNGNRRICCPHRFSSATRKIVSRTSWRCSLHQWCRYPLSHTSMCNRWISLLQNGKQPQYQVGLISSRWKIPLV